MKNIYESWKTSVVGLFLLLFSVLLITKHITMEEFLSGIGAISTIVLLLFRESKTENKDS
jgi:hypothetical protein